MANLNKNLREMYLRGRVEEGDIPYIDALFAIVMNRHFRGKKDREELLAECRFSVIQLVTKKQYDPSKSALNYTYTRIRNHITNVLAKKTPVSFTDQGILDGMEDDLLESPAIPYRPDSVMETVNEMVESFELGDGLRRFVIKYFADRFGASSEPYACYCSPDFYRQYLFYVRIIEWSLIQKYTNLSITKNRVTDLLPYLGIQKSQENMFKALATVFSEDVAGFLLYVLSGQSIKMPSRNKLLKTDQGFTIFKSWLERSTSVEELASKHYKSVSSICSIIERYDSNEARRS